MPVDPLSLALMAVNVGASVFNNWRNNKQSYKLQEKQQEFARAAAERNKQRMWQLMREGQELALEMERETHENRLKDIRNDFEILHRLAHAKAINSWPLKVLPIVMKNQSLGSLTATADENIAMHCILTPSNCIQFNKHIFPTIEEKLADFCNLHWSTLSSHPILFYSGAWKTGTIPTGVEVSQLKTNLSNLPTLLITPFFKPEGGIVFQINAWGIGVELETEIECTDFSYAESYKSGIDYLQEEDIKERTIEEFIPYLQCLIGYIADQYFWLMHNEAPLLPSLVATNNIISFDGKPYLKESVKNYYTHLVNTCQMECSAFPFNHSKALSLYNGTKPLYESKMFDRRICDLILDYCNRLSISRYGKIEEVINSELLCLDDLDFLRNASDCVYNQEILDSLMEMIKHIKDNLPKRYPRNAELTRVEIHEDVVNFSIDSVLNDFIQYCKKYNLFNISLLITQNQLKSYSFDTYDADTDEILCYRIPFNKTYRCESVDRLMNIKDLFNDGKTLQISCSYHRIEVLKSKIHSQIIIY